MIQRLLQLGLHYGTLPSGLRDRVCVTHDQAAAMLEELDGAVAERMIVNTCERFEVYAITTRAQADGWAAQLARWLDVPQAALPPHLNVRRADAAAVRLLRVAAGLESRIVGEPHVLGQVRAGYLQAVRAGATGPILDALARAAIHTGKRVRSETAINTSRRSIVTVAMEHLESELGDFAGHEVLVVGTGKLATDFVLALAERRTGRVSVASREVERATELAARVGGVGIAMSSMPAVLPRCDAVITCTHASEPLIIAPMILRTTGKALPILDLGRPRNVDPRVAELPHVRVTCMDDLLASENSACGDELASRIVQIELGRFLQWARGRQVVPRIARLVRRAGAHKGRDVRADSRALHKEITRLKNEVAA